MMDELQGAIRLFKGFLDNMGIPIAIIDQSGRYIYYNQESAEIDGCTVDHALGKPLLDIYPYISETDSTMLQSLHQGKVFINHHQNYFNAKGKLINYTHTTIPLVDTTDTIVGTIEFGLDVSGEIKLQQQLIALTKTIVKKEPQRRPVEQMIVTRSPKVKSLIDLAKRYAVNDIPVIIYGPSGSGKELFAQLIYEHSQRCHRPLIVLNCGAITESLIESTLFGTVKGAYTGAENSEGYLELANGGTLFLDEFNSMSLNVQTKLLRYLQTKQYCRVGDVRPRVSDARIIVAMNEDPEQLIRNGRLREDLYYRLSVAMLTLPSLNDRPEDIEPLAHHFIDKYATLSSAPIHGIANPEVLQRPWPGNVRMLENEMVRNIVMHDVEGPLHLQLSEVSSDFARPEPEGTPATTAHLPVGPEESEGGAMHSLNERVQKFERSLIVEALNRHDGNVSQAATDLGINRTTLLYKIQKYQIKFAAV